MHKPVKTSKKALTRASPATTKGKSPDGPRGIELIAVERGAGDLRAGLPVVLRNAESALLVLSAEAATAIRIGEAGRMAKGSKPLLLLTAERAQALKIRRYTPDVLAIELPNEPAEILKVCEIADPARDLANPLRGPFQGRREPLPGLATDAVLLMKIANFLPSAIVWALEPKRAQKLAVGMNLLTVNGNSVREYRTRAATELQMITRATLPLEHAQETSILAFRPDSGAREHLAFLIGRPSPDKPPLVRIHSECFTGDLLRSLKCDCGDQLRGAIQRMGADSGGGVLLYLAQEGRGIGLINKLRAYDLQDQGFDTIEANMRLGFEPDERQFEIASVILKRLGFKTIRLLTNNPKKVSALKSRGIKVAERVQHAFPTNPHNANYLQVKARKSGHLL